MLKVVLAGLAFVAVQCGAANGENLIFGNWNMLKGRNNRMNGDENCVEGDQNDVKGNQN